MTPLSSQLLSLSQHSRVELNHICLFFIDNRQNTILDSACVHVQPCHQIRLSHTPLLCTALSHTACSCMLLLFPYHLPTTLQSSTRPQPKHHNVSMCGSFQVTSLSTPTTLEVVGSTPAEVETTLVVEESTLAVVGATPVVAATPVAAATPVVAVTTQEAEAGLTREMVVSHFLNAHDPWVAAWPAVTRRMCQLTPTQEAHDLTHTNTTQGTHLSPQMKEAADI